MVTNREDVSIAIRSAFLKKGTQQKFSLIALIILSFVFLYLETLQTKPLKILRSITKDVIYRGSTIVSLPGKGFSSFSSSLSSHFYIKKENEKLKKENEKLKNLVYEGDFLKVENKQLKNLLDQEISSDTALRNAKVIVDKDSPFLKSIILNKGSKEKIKKGMAVLDENNFIGRIVEVNYYSSRVLLVSDLNSKIPVLIEPGGYQAILSGTGKEEPVLEYLPKDHGIEKGNKIYTSGKDGIFSSGIPIGEAQPTDDKVFVSLSSNLSQLSYVNISMDSPDLESGN